MDDVAHFDDIYAAGEELMNGGMGPVGVVEVCGTGRSEAGNVMVTGVHRRLNDGSNEGSIGFGYEGKLGDAEYTIETTLNARESTELTAAVTDPFGFSGNEFTFSASLTHSEEAENNDSYAIEWVNNPPTSNTILSIKASKEADAEAGVILTPAVSYTWQGMCVGAKALYDGGLGKLGGYALAMSQTVSNLNLSFLVQKGEESCEDVETKFTCAAVFDASEKCQFGGMFTKEQGSKPIVSLAAKYRLDEATQLKARADTTGLYAVACTLLISTRLTVSMFLQQQRGIDLSAKGGLTINYNAEGGREGEGGEE